MTQDELRKLIKQLRTFNQIDTKMQVSTILVLLEVALADAERRDLPVSDLQQKVGLLSGTASRNVYYWEDGHQHNTGGYGYVHLKVSPTDRRVRNIHLTPKGQAFVNNLS